MRSYYDQRPTVDIEILGKSGKIFGITLVPYQERLRWVKLYVDKEYVKEFKKDETKQGIIRLEALIGNDNEKIELKIENNVLYVSYL